MFKQKTKIKNKKGTKNDRSENKKHKTILLRECRLQLRNFGKYTFQLAPDDYPVLPSISLSHLTIC